MLSLKLLQYNSSNIYTIDNHVTINTLKCKWNTKEYHTVGTVSKSNSKNVETEWLSIALTYIQDRSESCTTTSTISGGLNEFYRLINYLYFLEKPTLTKCINTGLTEYMYNKLLIYFRYTIENNDANSSSFNVYQHVAVLLSCLLGWMVDATPPFIPCCRYC